LYKKVSIKTENQNQNIELINMGAEDDCEWKNILMDNEQFQEATFDKAKNFYEHHKLMKERKVQLESETSYFEFVNTKMFTTRETTLTHFISRLLNKTTMIRADPLQVADMEIILGYICNPDVYSRLLSPRARATLDGLMIYVDIDLYPHLKEHWLELQIGANPISGLNDLIMFDIPLIRIEKHLANVCLQEKITPIKHKIRVDTDNKASEDILKSHARASEIESNQYYERRAERKVKISEWENDKDAYIEKLYEQYFKENPINIEDYDLFPRIETEEYVPFKFKTNEELKMEAEQKRLNPIKLKPKFPVNKKIKTPNEAIESNFRKIYRFCRYNGLNNSKSLIWIQNHLNATKNYSIPKKYTSHPLIIPVKGLQQQINKTVSFLKNLEQSKIEAAKQMIYQKNEYRPDLEGLDYNEISVINNSPNYYKRNINKFCDLKDKIKNGFKFKDKTLNQIDKFDELLQEHLEIMSQSTATTVAVVNDTKILQATYRFQKRLNFNIIGTHFIRYNNNDVPTYLMDDMLWLNHVKGFIPKPKTIYPFIPKSRYSKKVRKLLTDQIYFDRID
jgi:hypothetical protein